jgi:choline-sulfatase
MAARPSLLLVSLDTTRADAVAPESPAADTPHLAGLARRGTYFRHAYTTAPMTLPAHASLLTGLYPSVHGVHENARSLAATHRLLAEELAAAGYDTAAFVSSFVLDRQFGLARGFAHYDDHLAKGASERTAGETTDRAVAWLRASAEKPFLLWVHYYDPHAPYAPPEPFRSRYESAPYRGEVAYLDAELGRLLAEVERHAGPGGLNIAVVGDHGEGLGEHGEAQHGNLLYQATMRVPLLLAGPGVPVGEVETPASARRVYGTLLAWAGRDGSGSLLAGSEETVLGEAMKPFLSFGWQPQVMAVAGRLKVIRSGNTEVYDVVADPREAHDLHGSAAIGRGARDALRAYPTPAAAPAGAPLDDEARKRLASLGYVASSGGGGRLRPDAPSPRSMTHLFADLDRASGLFARGDYAAAVPVFATLAEADPKNPMVAVYLAVAHSMLDHDEQALQWFRRAAAVAPESADLRHYQAMHHCKRQEWEPAEPLLESVLAQDPERLPALSCLSELREVQGRPAEAAALLDRVVARQRAPVEELLRLGGLRMASGETAAAIAAFERARELQGEAFDADLELGVLYLAARRLPQARDALDRVPPAHPGYAMALFKRAQVSVLLGEPDRRERVRRAAQAADATTRPLVEREALFRDLR